MYKVEFELKAEKQLQKMDKFQSKKLLFWIKKNLENCKNPYNINNSKCLSGNLNNFIRYKVGIYRIIAKIESKRLIILVVKIGHRKDVYKKISNRLLSKPM